MVKSSILERIAAGTYPMDYPLRIHEDREHRVQADSGNVCRVMIPLGTGEGR